jgi:hypothetical protein
VLVTLGLALTARARDAVEVISAATPWRAYLVLADGVYRQGDQLQYRNARGKLAPFDPATADPAVFRVTPQPAATWAQADFDDSAWPRYQGDLADFLGDYGVGVGDPSRALWPNRLCLRTAFGVADPAKATDLKLTIVCIGGAVAYVNGQEVGRWHLPAGALQPLTPAESYPIAAYTTEDGATALPAVGLTTSPEAKLLDRYAQRVRTVTITIPARLLMKGRNTLAIDLHAAPIAGPFSRAGWSHMGFRSATLTSASGAGVIAYAEACKGTHLWSANAVEQVTAASAEKSLLKRNWFWAIIWGRGLPVKGVQQGNPFDPVRPVRLIVPRNGTGSGQAVLTDSEGLRDVSAALGPLMGPGGATIPAKSVQVRFAVQGAGLHYCDALMPEAPKDAATVPVWLIVEAPKDQPPGWYTARLTLRANQKSFDVPVQVLVSGASVPNARDFTTTIGVMTSPDTIALQYGVAPWSDEHLALVEKSLALMAQLGNDVIHVPVILGRLGGRVKSELNFNLRPMIRFVQTPQGLKADYSILEKYLDAYTKHCAPPRAISLYIWSISATKEFAEGYERYDPAVHLIKSQANTGFKPPRVLVWDPKTGKTAEETVPVIGDPGSERFWKPLVDGVRDLVVRRGWSERIVMLGLGGDQRPGRKTVDLFKDWTPYARWNFLSHFSGDPEPKDGKLFAAGGAEIGMKEWPWLSLCRVQPATVLEQRQANPNDFLELPTERWHHQENSPPFLFRTLPQHWGHLGRIGLDYWMASQRDKPRATSFFSHTNALTVPGPGGAIPGVRFQMLREGVQDMEIRLGIVRACLKLPEEQRKVYRALLDELARRVEFGTPFYLSQSELQYDWPAYLATLHETAADLLGAKSEARWAKPPLEQP